VERTRVLIHLIDGAAPPDEALAQLRMIEHELQAWNPRLLKVRRIVAVSKQDLPEAAQTLEKVRAEVDAPVYGISAATGAGVKELVNTTYAAVLQARTEAQAVEQAEVVLKPRPRPNVLTVKVMKEGSTFRIDGSQLERVANMTDLETEEGRAYFERALVRTGARRKLDKLGAKPGDRIRVGSFEFTLL